MVRAVKQRRTVSDKLFIEADKYGNTLTPEQLEEMEKDIYS